VLPLFESGDLRVLIAATYSIDQAAEAYDHFTAGGKLGKIVLEI
jgi:NADPH:quinone reductase-like Zn-dependent oxidoreductase